MESRILSLGIEKLFKAKLIQNKCFLELNFIDVEQRRTTIRQHEKVNYKDTINSNYNLMILKHEKYV